MAIKKNIEREGEEGETYRERGGTCFYLEEAREGETYREKTGGGGVAPTWRKFYGFNRLASFSRFEKSLKSGFLKRFLYLINYN
jgi:hypothetical protein